MAAGTSAPAEAGQGPSLMSIAASIGSKIRDAAESAKEEREKAAAKGESPKKGSLFKSSLANQFNPVKSKKAKSQWAKQFDWNKKSDATEKVKAPPSGGGGDGGKAKLKEFIAGGFTAILQDTGMMVSKLDTVKAISGENLSEATKSSGTLTVIKETLDAQTELRRKALEEAKFARAEKKLEKREDVAGVNDTKPVEKEKGEGGDGEDEKGGGPFDWLLGGLDLLDTGLGIRSLLGGGQAAAGGGAAGGAGLGAGAIAAIVGGAGLAASGLGEGFFQLTKKGGLGEQTRDFFKNTGDEVGGPMGMMLGGIGNVAGFSNEATKATGTALDVVGAPFRYAIEALRNPFLSEEDKIKQAENLAKFDARVRENFRSGFNAIDFMNIVSDEKGAFGNIYGNQGAQADMMGKMSEGGMIKLAPGGIVDDPMRTTLYPGDSVIPLNRNVGKQMFGDNATGDDPSRIGLDTSAALILGISQSLLGQTDSGTVGDVVQQKIRKAAKEFGISNLTFTSSLGRAQFSKVDPQKSAGDFMKSLFSGIKVFGGGGGGGGGRNNRKNNNTDPSIGPGMTATGGSKASQYITSGFGQRNTGIPGASTNHGGIDVAGGPWVDGAAISVIKSGVVEETGDLGSKGWGRYVVVKHDDGTYSLYGHLSQINVKKGDKINDEGGDATVIGKVGSTGVSSGPHLHFELGKGWNGAILDKVDPARYVDNYVRGGGKVTVTGDAPEIAQAPSPPSTPSSLPAATVTPLPMAQDGMVGKKQRSWWDFGGRFDDWMNNARENATLGGNKFGGDRYKDQMKELGYKSGGTNRKRPNYNAMQKAARIKQQQASINQLNSGKGLDLKGASMGTNIGKGYPAVYKGREAIKVKLPPGGSYEPEITVGGKRFFAIKQGNSVIYASHFKANQKNLGVGTPKKAPTPAPAKAPTQADGTRPAAPSSSSPSTTAVVAPPTQSMGAKTAAAMGSFGDNVPAGKTSAMVFADFLYPDLV